MGSEYRIELGPPVAVSRKVPMAKRGCPHAGASTEASVRQELIKTRPPVSSRQVHRCAKPVLANV
jgi:hypothetical protein